MTTKITLLSCTLSTFCGEVLIANSTFLVGGEVVEHETQNHIEFLTRIENFGGTCGRGSADLLEDLDYVQAQYLLETYGDLDTLLRAAA